MRYADTDGTRIAYDDRGPWGSEPALLLLPGWCVNRGFFTVLAERLAAQRRVLTLDWRGHGDSGASSGELGHPELLRDALAVIEAAGARSVIPVGQAHGSWVGIELSRVLGERVPGLVALSWLVLEPPAPFRAVLDMLQDPERWTQARDQLFAMWTAEAPPALGARVREEMGRYGFELMAQAARAIAGAYARQTSPMAALSALPVPVPFLHLFSQPRAPEFLTVQETFATQHPWFEVRRLDALSHFPALEVPEAVAAEIERFVGARG